MYRINRLLINGSIIHFDYVYLPCNDPDIVVKELDLQEFGKLRFAIDVKTSYGKIVSEKHNKVIQNFIENYDVHSVAPLKV